MDLDITAYKLPTGIWAFDHPFNNTVAEALLNGTEKAIDDYYFKLNGVAPRTGDQIGIYLTTEKIKDADSVLTFLSTDKYGTTYHDKATDKTIWLCPWLQAYFGKKPKTMYVKARKESAKLGFIGAIAKVFGM